VARSTLQVRLVAVAAGLAAIFTTSLVAACGVGQVAETARIKAAVPGGNATVLVPAVTTVSSAILVQDATVPYNGPAGYAKGADVPLSMRIVNQTPFPVTVSPGDVTLNIGGQAAPAGTLAWADDKHKAAQNVPTPSESPSGKNGSPSPSGSPSELPTPVPSATPAAFDDITIAPFGAAILTADAGQYLQIQGLNGTLAPGDLVTVGLSLKVDPTKEVDTNGQPTRKSVTTYPATVVAPVSPPLSPAPRTTG
jgi:hypothetical protein